MADTPTAFYSQEYVNRNTVLSFYTSRSFTLPDDLRTCSIEQFQTVLLFAAKLLQLEKTISDEFTRDSLFAEYLKDINQKHSEQLAATEKKSTLEISSKLSPLVSKISEIEDQHRDTVLEIKKDYELQIKSLQKSKSTLESDLNAIKSDLKSEFTKESKTLSKRISELEAELQIASRSESSIRERCQQESDRLLKAVEEKNKQLNELKESAILQREQKLLQKEQELQSKLQRQTSSVLRGHDGEELFRNTAKEKMKWDLVKAPTFSCDSSSTIHGNLTLFEIKNYTNPIPQAEVNKFLRDMKMHPEARTGVFVSLNTTICNKDPSVPISLDWINASQCIMYIQSCADLDTDHTFSLIDQVIRISGIFNNFIASQTSESNEPVLQARIDQAKVYLDRTILRGASLIKKIMKDKKQQIEFIESATIHNISELKYQTADITTTIQTLLGEYSETTAETEETDGAEKPAVKKPNGKKKSTPLLSPGLSGSNDQDKKE
jgi:myosin heavy subunit